MEVSSDCESIKTEDFATKFSEIFNSNSKDSGFSCSKSERCLTPTGNNCEDSQINNAESTHCELAVPDRNVTNELNTKQNQTKPLSYTNGNVPKFKKLDLESLSSDYFEEQFRSIFNHDNQTDYGAQAQNNGSGRSFPTESCTTSLNIDVGNLSNVPPIRRDILNKFLSKYKTEMEHTDLQHDNHNSVMTNQNCTTSNTLPMAPRIGTDVIGAPPRDNVRKYGALYKNKSALADEIRAKSLRIQEEIHEERKRKLESSFDYREVKEYSTPREKLDVKVKELDQLTERMKKARCDREKIYNELNSLRKHVSTQEINRQNSGVAYKVLPTKTNFSESKLINSREISIGKSHLSHTGVDKIGHGEDNDQLTKLNQQLIEKKSYLKDLERKICNRMREIKDLESCGLNKKEIETVIEERNELYEILRKNDESSNDRYELEKQLSNVHEQLTYEQRRSREQLIDLEEQLNNSFKKFNNLFDEKEAIENELLKAEETLKCRDDEMNKLYFERNELRNLIDRCREEIESERQTSQEMLDKERKRFESQKETQGAQTTLQINELKNELTNTKSTTEKYKEQLKGLKEKLSDLTELKDKLEFTVKDSENNYKDAIRKLTDEYNKTTENLKKEFYASKENEIQMLKSEFDSEQLKTINNLRECYKQQVTDLQSRLENKSQECEDFRAEIRKLKFEYQEQTDEARNGYEKNLAQVKKEHERIVDSMDRNKAREFDELRQNLDELLLKTRKELEHERNANDSLREVLDKTKKELNNERESSKKQKHEKNNALHKIKELAKEKFQSEVKKIRDLYEKELEDQLKSVEQILETKTAELATVSKEKDVYQEECDVMNNTIQQIISDMIQLFKDQCSEMAKNGKFLAPSFNGLKYDKYKELEHVLETLKKNFQLTCREFQQFYQENLEKIKSDNEVSVKKVEEKNTQDFQSIKNQILKDHAEEINQMKQTHEQEISEMQRVHEKSLHKMKNDIREWKTKTAEKLANKLNKELRKEIEKKASARERKTSPSSLYTPRQDVTHSSNQKPIGLIEDLRGSIKHLREENLSLRKMVAEKSFSANGINQLDNIDNWNHCSHDVNGSISSLLPAKQVQQDSSLIVNNGYTQRPQSACQDCFRRMNNSKIDSNSAGRVGRSESFKHYH